MYCFIIALKKQNSNGLLTQYSGAEIRHINGIVKDWLVRETSNGIIYSCLEGIITLLNLVILFRAILDPW